MCVVKVIIRVAKAEKGGLGCATVQSAFSQMTTRAGASIENITTTCIIQKMDNGELKGGYGNFLPDFEP